MSDGSGQMDDTTADGDRRQADTSPPDQHQESAQPPTQRSTMDMSQRQPTNGGASLSPLMPPHAQLVGTVPPPAYVAQQQQQQQQQVQQQSEPGNNGLQHLQEQYRLASLPSGQTARHATTQSVSLNVTDVPFP